MKDPSIVAISRFTMLSTKSDFPPICPVWSTVDIRSGIWTIRVDSSSLSSSTSSNNSHTMVRNIHYWRVTIRGETTTEGHVELHWFLLYTLTERIYTVKLLPLVSLVSLIQLLLVPTAATAASQQLYCHGTAVAVTPCPHPSPRDKGEGQSWQSANFLSPDVLLVHASVKLRFSGDFAIKKQLPVNLISRGRNLREGTKQRFHEFLFNFQINFVFYL